MFWASVAVGASGAIWACVGTGVSKTGAGAFGSRASTFTATVSAEDGSDEVSAFDAFDDAFSVSGLEEGFDGEVSSEDKAV